MKKSLIALALFALTFFPTVLKSQVVSDTLLDGKDIIIINTPMSKGMVDGERVILKNGKKHITQEFKMGFQEGDEIWFYENGRIETIAPYRNGVIHGVYSEWSKSGKCVKTRFYYNGQRYSKEVYNNLKEKYASK